MKKWAVNKPDRKIVSDLMTSGGITSLAASVLAARGFVNIESVFKQLETNELSDPFLIKDMDKAADIINNAIDDGTKICIYGDYDCDGIMACAILYQFLSENGADAQCYIPERSEGYGMNQQAIRKLADQGFKLIITVDNGISAANEAELVYQLGMKLVITDHHQPGDNLPRAEAVIDPHRTDCFSPFKKLCGAAVALKLVAALDGGDYTMALEQFGDLAAIATIADIVDLTGENRYIADYGIRLIQNTDRAGLIALLKSSGLTGKTISSVSIAFTLAPRINSAGRFGSPTTALKLILSDDLHQAEEIASELETLNSTRKNAENDIISEIYSKINNDPSIIRQRILFFCGKNWHHGVIGIVASKLLEKFGKPCFIMSECNGEVRGSARSFGEFSVFKALTATSQCLEKFGGHPGAGGFTVKPDKISEFKDTLLNYALNEFPIMPALTINADVPINPRELTVDNVRGLKVLEPFGAGNQSPLFLIQEAQVIEIIPLSDGVHSKLKIKIGTAFFFALIFRMSPDELSVHKDDFADFIVSLDINTFKNMESVSLIVKDYRLHGIKQSSVFAASAAFEAFCRNEKLPDAYYKSMLPSYDELKIIYLSIPKQGISFDSLFNSVYSKGVNYCKMLAAIDAFTELKLISADYASEKLQKLSVTKKTDMNCASIIQKLHCTATEIK